MPSPRPCRRPVGERRRLVRRLDQHRPPTVAGETGDAEAGNLRVRLIAIENLVAALLAEAPDSQSALVREMAAYISPRPDATPHRLTVEAARNMFALVERAAHYKSLDRDCER